MRRPGGERGSATVEFALVAPLVTVVAIAIIQLALTLHVRSTAASAAAEGARASALAGADLQAGERRARALLAATLADDLVSDVTATRQFEDGLAVVRLGIDLRLPLIGMLGPTAMHVDGHALSELS